MMMILQVNSKWRIETDPIASFQIETFEVIGNVWQNPELLEGVN